MNVIKKNKQIGKYYLYSHIRLDNNEVFYIGIGKQYENQKSYTRAKSKQRNKIWYSIVDKTNYIIQILDESDDFNYIKSIEIKLIKQYGKIIDNNGGILSNMTNGGEGHLGYVDYNYTKKVYLYSKDGIFYKEFNSYAECGRFLQLKQSVYQFVDKPILVKNYIAKSYKNEFIEPILDIKEKLKNRLSKTTYQYDVDFNLIKKWKSSSEASRILKINGSHIREVCAGSKIRKKAGGYIWSYDIINKQLNNEDVPVQRA
jgi:hypothetical protein